MNKSQIIIDVREPLEFKSGHIEGALNIPPSELMSGKSAIESMDKDSKIIVYCRSGSRSNATIQILKQKGFTNLINGINAEHVKKNYLDD